MNTTGMIIRGGRFFGIGLLVCATLMFGAALTLPAQDARADDEQDAEPPHPGVTAFRRSDYFTAAELLLQDPGGHPMAPAILGQLFRCGLGVPLDEIEALHWYRQAAGGPIDLSAVREELEARHPGVPPGGVELIMFNEKRFEFGRTGALMRLARVHEHGRGVLKDLKQALFYYKEAAERGSVFGAYEAARLYLDGAEGEKNTFEAARWMRFAAEKGHPIAQRAMGDFIFGDILPGTPKDALVWYLMAAKRNYVRAQFAAGLILAGGLGVEKNLVIGAAWLRLAHGRLTGEEAASRERALEEISEVMSAEQRQDANRRVRAFIAGVKNLKPVRCLQNRRPEAAVKDTEDEAEQ